MNSFKTKQRALLIHGGSLKKFQKKTFSTVSDEYVHCPGEKWQIRDRQEPWGHRSEGVHARHEVTSGSPRQLVGDDRCNRVDNLLADFCASNRG